MVTCEEHPNFRSHNINTKSKILKRYLFDFRRRTGGALEEVVPFFVGLLELASVGSKAGRFFPFPVLDSAGSSTARFFPFPAPEVFSSDDAVKPKRRGAFVAPACFEGADLRYI